jgi:hypothetical protein
MEWRFVRAGEGKVERLAPCLTPDPMDLQARSSGAFLPVNMRFTAILALGLSAWSASASLSQGEEATTPYSRRAPSQKGWIDSYIVLGHHREAELLNWVRPP